MRQLSILRLYQKFNKWRNLSSVRMGFAWAMVTLAPILVLLTIIALRNLPNAPSSRLWRSVIAADMFYAISIVGLILWSISRIYIARKKNSAGSQLHMRLGGTFAMLALIPTLLVATFAALVINVGLEGWFSTRVRAVVGASLSAAEAYEAEQQSDLEEYVELIAMSLNDLKRRKPFFADAGELRVVLTHLHKSLQRGLKETYIIDGTATLIARGELSYLFGFETPSQKQLELAMQGKTVIIQDWKNDEFRALVRLTEFSDRYLYVSRSVDGDILSLLDDTKETVKLYNQMESERGQLLFSFSLIYLGFTAIITMSAIWIGLMFAERLARPIGRLVWAARRVGRGDLDVRVAEEKGDDEIASLGRAFNTMTSQVKKQRDDLIEVNAITERSRRLFDGVLSGVTAGVVGLTKEGRISVMNAAAERILNLDIKKDLNSFLAEAVPEFSTLFHEVENRKIDSQQEQINLTRTGSAEILLVKMAERRNEDGLLEGYVVTFDDVTNLVSAQRMAAWGDVARRIAHEIKNPLTPIQLSAERIARKFAPLVGDEADNLKQYISVIVRQVNDLRRIVDEFSKFARMPEPDKRTYNLSVIIKDAVILQQASYENITLELINDIVEIWMEIDETMISQALINLLQNALESVEIKINNNPNLLFKPLVKIYVIRTDNQVSIEISDNGIGLPDENRSRLFEPYVTRRKEGTGLGLSIVKKIIEEHDGILELLDAPYFKGCLHKGALAKIILPISGITVKEG